MQRRLLSHVPLARRWPLSTSQRATTWRGLAARTSRQPAAFSTTTRRSIETMAPSKAPAVPRPSASLIVVNARNEILFVHRNPKSSAFAGMHVRSVCRDYVRQWSKTSQVFPGGNYDSKQDDDLALTAIRETFEETGLLLASSKNGRTPSDDVLDRARDAVHSQKLLFRDFLSQHALTADRHSLMPFTQWITPPNQPRCARLLYMLSRAGFDANIAGGSRPSSMSRSSTLSQRPASPPERKSNVCLPQTAAKRSSLRASSIHRPSCRSSKRRKLP